MDFDSLSAQLLARSEALCCEWLPAGKRRGHEYVVGDLQGNPGDSLSINLNTGRWADFATGEAGGDFISLYAAMHRIEQGEAYKQLTNGHAPAALSKPATRKPAAPTDLAIVLPVPDDAPACRLVHPTHGKPSASWAYRDKFGALLGHVARYDPPEGRKQIVPWVWADGRGWVMKQFPDPRPLYGLERLVVGARVLIVEGEKAADAAQAIVGDRYAVLTWPGGAQALGKADFSDLAGHKVLLWPDADKPGVECMQRLAARLDRCPEVKVLDVADMPDGWDAADCGFDWPAFLAWARPRARTVEAPTPAPAPAPTPPARPPTPPSPPTTACVADYYSPLPNVTAKGKPMSTIENVGEICRRLGLVVRYNVISKEEEILIPGSGFSLDNRQNASLAWLISECAKFSMPVDRVPDFVTYLADQNQYNPVARWVTSKPWDGQDRLSDLMDTVRAKGEASDPRVGAMKQAFIRRWMLSAVAAAFRPEGVSAHGVLVFQGDQYIGKTKWFKQLVPADLGVLKDGMLLRPDDRDSVMKCVSNWLVELGEIDATFRKSDVAALKSFLTSDRDVLRRAYARKESTFARRTVFFASVNPKNYLHDETGNRRYWTIECEWLDYNHGVDMQQCWAQVYEQLFLAGESWFLTPEELDLLNAHNEDFTVIDPIEDLITNGLRWSDPEMEWKWRTATDVLVTLGRQNCSKTDVTKAGIIMRRLNGDRSKRTGSARLLLVPDTLVTRVSDRVTGWNP